jgi:CBS domain-containing protein
MKIQEIMTEDVAACAPEDGTDVAARIMRDRECGIVPVVKRSREVVGVITDRDICLAALTWARPLAQIPVNSAMTAGVRCCAPTDTIYAAEASMRAGRIRRLPVVDERRRLVGLVSIDDIAAAVVRAEGQGLFSGGLDEAAFTRTVAAVCRRRVIAGV